MFRVTVNNTKSRTIFISEPYNINMKELNLVFKGLAPYSVNNTHYKSGRRKVTFRKWVEGIQLQLCQYEKEIDSFVTNICNKTTFLTIQIIHVMPEKKFFTGAKNNGGISLQTKDLSNVEKPLIDAIFDKRYDGRKFEYLSSKEKVKTLCVDDKLIVDLRSRKMPSSKTAFLISVKIQCHKLEEIEYWD